MAKKKTKTCHGHKGLSGIEKVKEAGKQVLQESSKPLLIVAGIWVGNMTGKAVDKMFPVSSDTGKFQWKSIIKPVVQVGAGGTIIFFGRKNDYVKSFGYGFAGAGLISGVKLLKKDLFSGLGDTEESSVKPVEAKYYREAKEEMMKLLQDNAFKPALPEIPSSTPASTPTTISAVDEEPEQEMSGLNIENAEVL